MPTAHTVSTAAPAGRKPFRPRLTVAGGVPQPVPVAADLHPAARWALTRLANDCLVVDFGGSDRQGDPVLYRWSGTHWDAVPALDLAGEALQWLVETARPKARSGLAREAANTLLDLARKQALPLPVWPRADGAVLGTRSHDVIVSPDGVLRAVEHDPAHGLTALIQADLDPAQIDAGGVYTPRTDRASRWDRFVEQVLPDAEVRALAQEAVGSTLLDATLERIIALVGDGENGKSVFVHCLVALHARSHTALSLRDLSSGFGLETLVGKTLATITEAESHISDAGLQILKALASRDPMRADRKHNRALSFIPRATVVLALNNPLSHKDQSHGALRRWLSIPFVHRVREEDRIPDLHRLITDDPAEMQALLDWALLGAQRLVRRGMRLPVEPAAVKRVRQQQRASTDAVYAWLHDQGVKAAAPGSWWPKAAIYTAFREWAADSGRGEHLADVTFWRRVRAELAERGETLRQARGPVTSGVRGRLVALAVPGITAAPLFGGTVVETDDTGDVTAV